jgi:dTDP-4-dehydrorhamnose reductase
VFGSGRNARNHVCREAIVNPILVVGADTVAGANLCVHWADKFDVFAASSSNLNLAGCRALVAPGGGRADAIVAEVHPRLVVLCGPAARSSWEENVSAATFEGAAKEAARWAGAAAKVDAKFVFISSDAVFAGPWMFHDEGSDCLCESSEAARIREAESEAARCHPGALVVRTNVFGWSPASRGGWLETTLAAIEARRPLAHDAIRHATPVLATDLAEILERALEQQLEGTYHVAGAERVSPLDFAYRLAGQFNLPWPSSRCDETLTEARVGFGAGECSLQTKKIRRDVCMPMPLLSEALDRLEAQQWNGHREKLAPVGSVQLRAA